jgi:hypothetical protein
MDLDMATVLLAFLYGAIGTLLLDNELVNRVSDFNGGTATILKVLAADSSVPLPFLDFYFMHRGGCWSQKGFAQRNFWQQV